MEEVIGWVMYGDGLKIGKLECKGSAKWRVRHCRFGSVRETSIPVVAHL